MRTLKHKVAVVHFLPLEYYPPVVNFLNVISKNQNDVLVFSTHNGLDREVYKNEDVSIYRYPLAGPNRSSLFRLWHYFNFNICVFLRLLWHRPNKVLYYESYSAFPIYLYLKIFRQAELYIHFHEYFDSEWYERGMKLVQLYHKLEVSSLFRKAKWISQTNEFRAKLFCNDFSFLPKEKLKVVPNYPPKTWSTALSPRKNESVVKMVYIGALSFEKTYIRELVEWVSALKGKVSVDIYSYNIKEEVKLFLKSKSHDNVNFVEGGIEYDKIPLVLKSYSVGLILYKGITANYRYNATNKLFEYLACNLDVWFPEELEGIYPYITENTYPKVLKCNFNTLNVLNVDEATDKSNLVYQPSKDFAENAFEELMSRLCANYGFSSH